MKKLRLRKIRCLPKVSRLVNSRAGIWSHTFFNHKAWIVYSLSIATHLYPHVPWKSQEPGVYAAGSVHWQEENVFCLGFQGFKQLQDPPVQSPWFPLVPAPTLSEPATQNGGRCHCRRGKAGQAFHSQGTWKQFPEKQQSTSLRSGTLACHSSALWPGKG